HHGNRRAEGNGEGKQGDAYVGHGVLRVRDLVNAALRVTLGLAHPTRRGDGSRDAHRVRTAAVMPAVRPYAGVPGLTPRRPPMPSAMSGCTCQLIPPET